MEIEFAEKKVAFAGPWIGEFGWEIMTWVPYLRKLSRDYDKMYISTFEGVEALYTGFHCEVEFVPHGYPERTDDWVGKYIPSGVTKLDKDLKYNFPSDVDMIIGTIKTYKADGEYVRYGSPVIKDVSILFHARGVDPQFKNWPLEKWKVLAKEFPGAASIGSETDMIPTAKAYTGGDLATLMDLIASASVVIGQSSGVMHLALMCGTPVVVWGDDKLMNFGESLETRYKETWNPFNTPVTWINCEKAWDPDPEQALEALKPDVPDLRTLSLIKQAAASGQYMVAVGYMGENDGKECLYAQCGGTFFPANWLDKAGEDMIRKIQQSISQAKAERIPVSWL